MNRDRSARALRGERGAATLVVVMVLFFIVSMVAAYTSRNLVFEQKTGANQYRSTVALEAADAGLQWALGLLNSGRIDSACAPTTNVGMSTFRDRYLSVDGTTGAVVPANTLLPSCVFNGSNWVCSCPSSSAPSLTPPSGAGVFPAFRVRFLQHVLGPQDSTVTGIVKVEVNGCTRYADSCLNFPATGEDNEGRVKVSALLVLKGAVTTAPAAPLTARGAVNLGGAALTAINGNAASGGVTIHAGGLVDTTGMTIVSAPGTPAATSVRESDPSLAGLTADRMFSNTFGMAKSTYRDQPGAVVLTCPCTSSTLINAAAQNPGRVFWLNGDLVIDSASDIGTPADPLAIIVSGNVQFLTAANIYGLLYTQAATWNSAGNAQVQGAVVAEGDVGGSMSATLAYDPDVLGRVRYRAGSFVMLPASWKDYE